MARSRNTVAEKKTKAVLRVYNSEIGAAEGVGIPLYEMKDAPKTEDEAVEFYMDKVEGDTFAVLLDAGDDYCGAFRVLYRAAEVRKIMTVIPGILLPSEVEQVREWAKSARESLAADGLAQGKMRVGIAIETPSAAILADLLAPMVDFFVLDPIALKHSLGLRDSDAMPESVKRCVKMACAAAKREDFEVRVRCE